MGKALLYKAFPFYISGGVKDVSQIGLQALAWIKSTSNGGILQVLHVSVLLVPPLGAGHED